MFLKRFLAARPRTLPRGEQRDRQGEGLEDMSGVFHLHFKNVVFALLFLYPLKIVIIC